MTQEQLELLKWEDFSIMEIEGGNKVLILLCSSVEVSQNLKALLATSNYNLALFVDDATGKCIMNFDLLDTEYRISFHTGKTVEDYFPLTWMIAKNVQFITTGIKEGGGLIRWDDNYLDLIPAK